MSVDDQIDDILGEGPNTASNIARRTGASRQYVWDRLNARDDIKRVDDGLYRHADADTARADIERLTDIRNAIARLKIEVTKQNETSDELHARTQRIEDSVAELIDDLNE